jgi:hypothetical protein
MSRLNIDLLRKVKKHITEEPKRLIMEDWFRDYTEAIQNKEFRDFGYRDFKRNPPRFDGLEHPLPACNTVACIAGWVCVVGKIRGTKDFITSQHSAAKILGIVDYQAQKELFFLDSWPEKYQNEWLKTDDLTKRAKIACNRIEAFIKQYKDKDLS